MTKQIFSAKVRTSPASSGSAYYSETATRRIRQRRRRFSTSCTPLLFFLCSASVLLRRSNAVGLRGGTLRRPELLDNTDHHRDHLVVDDQFHQPLVQQEKQYNQQPTLSCEIDFGSHEHCPISNNEAVEQTPVCEYDESRQTYDTVCLDTNSSGIALLYNPHPKSYCGKCHRCFESTEELRKAVKRYESYKVVDMDLAEKYGWPIGRWCTDKITDMSNVFLRQSSFNEPLQNWDTSKVTSMQAMFQNAYDFNQPLNHLNVSQVQNMERMFAMAIHFDQPLHNWDVSSVTAFGYQFLHAIEFNQNLASWQVHNADNLNSMFYGATNFEQAQHQDLRDIWNIHPNADTDHMMSCQWDSSPSASSS